MVRATATGVRGVPAVPTGAAAARVRVVYVTMWGEQSSQSPSRHLVLVRRLAGVASVLFAVVGGVAFAELPGSGERPEREGVTPPSTGEELFTGAKDDVQVAQATFVRQDVIYTDRVVTAAPTIGGVLCGVRCGEPAGGTIRPDTVRERYWSRTDLTVTRPVPPSSICDGTNCPSR